MTSNKEYIAFKQAFCDAIKQITGIPVKVTGDRGEDFATFDFGPEMDMYLPETNLHAIYGMLLSKKDPDSTYVALVDKALTEMSTYPTAYLSSDMFTETYMTKDDVFSIVYPCIVNPTDDFNPHMLIHRNVMDKVLCYKVSFVRSAENIPIVSAFVTFDCADSLDITEEELYEASLENLGDIAFTCQKQDDGYLITAGGTFDGSVIQYLPHGMDIFMKQIKSDEVYLLPLSTKNLLAVPKNDKVSIADLKKKLKKNNANQFNVLSDEVYICNKDGVKIIR